jgi:hypothetical protein
MGLSGQPGTAIWCLAALLPYLRRGFLLAPKRPRLASYRVPPGARRQGADRGAIPGSCRAPTPRSTCLGHFFACRRPEFRAGRGAVASGAVWGTPTLRSRCSPAFWGCHGLHAPLRGRPRRQRRLTPAARRVRIAAPPALVCCSSSRASRHLNQWSEPNGGEGRPVASRNFRSRPCRGCGRGPWRWHQRSWCPRRWRPA